MSDSNGIEWVAEPPSAKRGSYAMPWHGRLLPFLDKPGEWGRIETRTATTAYQRAHDLNSGRITHPPGDWKFVGRTVDGKSYLYARFLGPEKAGKA